MAKELWSSENIAHYVKQPRWELCPWRGFYTWYSHNIFAQIKTASLRHVSGFPASVFTAFPVRSGFSDYYGSSVAMPDFQCLTHSPFGHSGLGNLQLTKVVGKCELSDCAFVPFTPVLRRAVRHILDNVSEGNPL